jgi:hypothetical protein
MAKPRVFVCSTYYDLRFVRADLEKFIRSIGYEPVLNERGSIPYSRDEKLESSCYREVNTVDILVCIIGGRFGSASQHDPYSITQLELKTALDAGKQVYVFVERSVLGEYRTYLRNKAVPGITYQFADDPRVYAFLEEIHALPMNNVITGFEASEDIVAFLREQWAGLFQRLLETRTRIEDGKLTIKLNDTAKTLDQLVTFLTTQKGIGDEVLRGILLPAHPAFKQLAELTGAEYRLFFTDREEMGKWLRARGWSETSSPVDSTEVWIRRYPKFYYTLSIDTQIFDDEGKLRVMTSQEWKKEWIKRETTSDPVAALDADDTPF